MSAEVMEVARFRAEGEARLLAGRLDADGIAVRIRGSGSPRSAEGVWFLVEVAAPDFEAAREIAARDHSHLLEAEFPGVGTETEVCPRCGSAALVRRERGGLVAGLVRLVFGVSPMQRRCAVCGVVA